jgi:hypothetical protein
LEKKDIHGCPVCVHLVRALPGNRPVPVTAFTIDEQMHLMAAGFADGSVVLYRGYYLLLLYIFFILNFKNIYVKSSNSQET